MSFFSTAQNSPRPGAYSRQSRQNRLDQQQLALKQQQLDQQERERQQQLDQQAQAFIEKKNKEARINALSQSLLSLEKVNKETVTSWALTNKVTPKELEILKPVFDMKKEAEPDHQWGPIKEDDLGWYMEDNVTGDVRYIRTKAENKDWGSVKVDEKGQYQIDPSGKKVYVNTPKDPVTWSGVKLDKDKRRYQISSTNEIKYIDPVKKEEKDWSPVRVDANGFEYQIGPNNKKIYTNKPKITSKDKVADWYKTLTREIKGLYLSDNMIPTEVQRKNYERAFNEALMHIEKTSQAFGITYAEAMPYAMQKLRKRHTLKNKIAESAPRPDRSLLGYIDNLNDTTIFTRKALEQGVDPSIMGELLTEKGWSDQEAADILVTATHLVKPEEVGVDLAEVKKLNLHPGQGFTDQDGVTWVLSKDRRTLVGSNGKRILYGR